MSWLDNLVSKIVPRYKYYEMALEAIREDDKARLEMLLRQNPPLIQASYCISGSLLHNAAMLGQVEITKMLITRGANVNDTSTRDTEAPLHFAAEAGQLETIKILVEHGAAINALCFRSTQSPLERAVWSQTGAHKDIIRYLVANNAQHSGIHVSSVLGDVEQANNLLNSGADINSKDRSGSSPLHWAVQGGDTAKVMVDYLISRGADVEGGKSKGSATPLYIAACNGNLAAVEILLANGANVNAETAFRGRPFLAAQSQGYMEIANLLLESGAEADAASAFGETGLHDAVAENDIEMLKTILSKGCNLNAMSNIVPIRTPSGKRMWQMIPKNSFAPLHIAAERGYVTAAELLIEHGADVNKCDRQGRTSLHMAASKGQTEIVSLLLLHGADPAIKDCKGKTALDLARKANKEDLVSVIKNWECGNRNQ